MQIVSTSSIGSRNVVFDNTEDYVGGANLDATRIPVDTDTLKAGTPVYLNTSTRVAEVVKTATLEDGSSSTVLYVEPGHLFASGEYVTDGRITSAINSIAASGDLEAITVASALSTYAADTVIVESQSTSKFGIPVAATMELGGDGGTIDIYSSNADNAGLAFVITAATGDALNVGYSANTVTIRAASGTASNNTDLLITQAINDITSTEWDFRSIQFLATDAWDGDDADATGQTCTLAATVGYKYEANGFIKDDVTVGDGAALYENLDASVVIAGTVREGALPFPLTTKQKTALKHFKFNA
jgi:hypothetical protein